MASTGTRECWVNVEDAAEHVGMSVPFMYQNWKRLGMPCCKVGGSLRFKLSELDAWAEGQGA